MAHDEWGRAWRSLSVSLLRRGSPATVPPLHHILSRLWRGRGAVASSRRVGVSGVTRRHVGPVNPPLLAFGARKGWAGAERNPLSLAFGAREGVGYDEGCQRRKTKNKKLLLSRVWVFLCRGCFVVGMVNATATARESPSPRKESGQGSSETGRERCGSHEVVLTSGELPSRES